MSRTDEVLVVTLRDSACHDAFEQLLDLWSRVPSPEASIEEYIHAYADCCSIFEAVMEWRAKVDLVRI